MNSTRPIAIAGAGIGGLTLGCMLARHGIPFRIFEKAPALAPVGAGIALADNALRALAHAGLAEAVRAAGQPLRQADICDSTARVIVGMRELPFPVVVMARTELQQALLAPIAGHVECNRGVAGYAHRDEGVVVRFDDGAEMEAALLIGADGLRSRVRAAMHGDEPLRYSGQTSWRAIAEPAGLPDTGRMTESWGPGLRFGIVPLTGGRVYWFAVAEEPSGGRDAGGVGATLRAKFEGWHAPIDAVIASTDDARIVRTDIFDRPPIRAWAEGRAVLLGDAAHPMTPNLGMGGCQAIEDAVVLGNALARESGVEAALAHYQARRVSRANRFVNRSFTFGRLAHARSRPVRWLRDRALGALSRGLALRALRRDLDFRL
ncbi:MAG TPA: FAD-dependent monooxygenase [Vicinamibacterales bacterium]|nr:FAD-dependent monooxygenase [Vicinamibacterales bacterium]